eukprot:scaffold21571_cov120-Isochrysis_galbana.AAC.8
MRSPLGRPPCPTKPDCADALAWPWSYSRAGCVVAPRRVVARIGAGLWPVPVSVCPSSPVARCSPPGPGVHWLPACTFPPGTPTAPMSEAAHTLPMHAHVTVRYICHIFYNPFPTSPK